MTIDTFKDVCDVEGAVKANKYIAKYFDVNIDVDFGKNEMLIELIPLPDYKDCFNPAHTIISLDNYQCLGDLCRDAVKLSLNSLYGANAITFPTPESHIPNDVRESSEVSKVEYARHVKKMEILSKIEDLLLNSDLEWGITCDPKTKAYTICIAEVE